MIDQYDEYEIEDLGVCEEWVYDIEVDINHNFFGNNILVHNSVYFHIAPFMEKYIFDHPNESMDDYVTAADNFEQEYIKPIVDKSIEDFAKELNAYNPEVIGASREIIADRGVFTDKKKAYYARVRDDEGTRMPEDEPYIKVMGMDVVKSGTPAWSKKKLKEAIPKILDSSEKELKEWLASIKHEYTQVPLHQIANMGGVNNLDYKLGQGRVPIGSRTAIVYNNYLKDNDLDGIYEPVMVGDKSKRLQLLLPNKFKSDVIAFMPDNFVNEIPRESVNYDLQYEKTFMKMLHHMTRCLDYKIFQETQSLADDDW